MTTPQESSDKPPFFKTWKTIYLIVIGNLVVLVLLFYLFSQAFL